MEELIFITLWLFISCLTIYFIFRLIIKSNQKLKEDLKK